MDLTASYIGWTAPWMGGGNAQELRIRAADAV